MIRNEDKPLDVERVEASNPKKRSRVGEFDVLAEAQRSFSKIPSHQVKSEVLEAYYDMERCLEDEFRKAANSGTVITPEHISNIFASLSNKRRKLE